MAIRRVLGPKTFLQLDEVQRCAPFLDRIMSARRGDSRVERTLITLPPYVTQDSVYYEGSDAVLNLE